MPQAWRVPLRWGHPEPSELAQLALTSKASPLTAGDLELFTAHDPDCFTSCEETHLLGRGSRLFTVARTALQSWSPYRVPGVVLPQPIPALTEGQTFVFGMSKWGLHMIGAVRIMEVVDTDTCFGFTTGTLDVHPLVGQERFTLTLDAREQVHYRVQRLCGSAQLGSIARGLVGRVRTQFVEASRRAMFQEIQWAMESSSYGRPRLSKMSP